MTRLLPDGSLFFIRVILLKCYIYGTSRGRPRASRKDNSLYPVQAIYLTMFFLLSLLAVVVAWGVLTNEHHHHQSLATSSNIQSIVKYRGLCHSPNAGWPTTRRQHRLRGSCVSISSWQPTNAATTASATTVPFLLYNVPSVRGPCVRLSPAFRLVPLLAIVENVVTRTTLAPQQPRRYRRARNRSTLIQPSHQFQPPQYGTLQTLQRHLVAPACHPRHNIRRSCSWRRRRRRRRRQRHDNQLLPRRPRLLYSSSKVSRCFYPLQVDSLVDYLEHRTPRHP